MHPTNNIMWESDPVPGKIQGTPIISQGDQGLYIFFTHNRINKTSNEIVGSFSIIDGSDGSLMFSEIAGDSRMDPDLNQLRRVDTLRLPYAALGVAHKPEWGKYPGGEGNVHDVLLWSTSVSEGREDAGYTRAFQLPKLFEPEFTPALSTYFLQENRWNAITAPALTLDGMNAVFGVRENKVIGWTGGEDFNELPSTKQSLGTDPNDERLRKCLFIGWKIPVSEEYQICLYFVSHLQPYPFHRSFPGRSGIFWQPPQPLSSTLYKARVLISVGRCQGQSLFPRNRLFPTMTSTCTPPEKMVLSQLLT
jgi:hypothetical protein